MPNQHRRTPTQHPQMPSQRQQRVNNLLQIEISDIIRREINDPKLGFVTITSCDISPDLRHALVYVSILGDDKAKANSMRVLIRARSVIRGLLGDRIELRCVPLLKFKLDDTAENAQRMAILLAELAAEIPDEDDDTDIE